MLATIARLRYVHASILACKKGMQLAHACHACAHPCDPMTEVPANLNHSGSHVSDLSYMACMPCTCRQRVLHFSLHSCRGISPRPKQACKLQHEQLFTECCAQQANGSLEQRSEQEMFYSCPSTSAEAFFEAVSNQLAGLEGSSSAASLHSQLEQAVEVAQAVQASPPRLCHHTSQSVHVHQHYQHLVLPAYLASQNGKLFVCIHIGATRVLSIAAMWLPARATSLASPGGYPSCPASVCTA